MPIEIRSIEPEEIVDYLTAKGRAFGYHPYAGAAEDWTSVNSIDRAFAAFEGEQIVGTTTSYPFDLTLPGGASVPVAGVAGVAVVPTHRRRGIMRALIDHQRKDIAARGEVASALWPSESSIYGRFGFGPATRQAGVRVLTPRSHHIFDLEDDDGTIAFVNDDAAARTLSALHREFTAATTGEIARSDAWLRKTMTAGAESEGYGAPFHVFHAVDGTVDGWMSYRYKKTGPRASHMVMKVDVVFATDDAARHALWKYAFSLDLVEELTATNIPVDDPLLLSLASVRDAEVHYSDGMWMQIDDVPAVFAGRKYSRAGYVTFSVDGARTFSIDADGTGAAECIPTSANAAFDVEEVDLAALVMGTVRPRDMYRSGRLGPCDSSTLSLIDDMFAVDQAPYCSLHF